MNFSNILPDLSKVSNGDYLHVDVMDGKFVPQKTIWVDEVKLLKQSELLKDVHLMIEEPEKYVEAFIEAGGDIINFHIETAKDAEALIEKIHSLGAKAGVSINPETPFSEVEKLIPLIDQLMVMSVHPGKGGQEFISEVMEKVRKAREMREDLDIEVDGGVDDQTARICVEAGANVLCSGSYIFTHEDPKAAINILRKA